MSNVAIKGGATGTATYTIEAPTGNTDRTLVLPDEAGTVLTSASDIVASQLPAGSVVQVLESTAFDATYITSTSFQDIDLAVSITPKATSSKILVMANGSYTQDGVDNTLGYVQLVRDTTAIANHLVGYDTPGGNVGFDWFIQKLDSPSSSVSVTYKVQARTTNASSSWRPQGTMSIIVMEIAG